MGNGGKRKSERLLAPSCLSPNCLDKECSEPEVTTETRMRNTPSPRHPASTEGPLGASRAAPQADPSYLLMLCLGHRAELSPCSFSCDAFSCWHEVTEAAPALGWRRWKCLGWS